MLLAQGQAAVKREFSVNKEVTVEDFGKQSLIFRRIIVDHIHTSGGIKKVDQLMLTKDTKDSWGKKSEEKEVNRNGRRD